MPVIVYNSNDPGAPAMSGQAGSLITVLDACLINGYGSKVSAGWTKAFSGLNKADYRQGMNSLQQYLDIDDAGPGAGGTLEARIRGYESMSALSTGINPYPTVVQDATALKVRKSVTIDAVVRPWVVIADQRTMYMFILTGDIAGTYFGWGFGEYYTFKTNDEGRNFIQGRTVENSATTLGSADGFDQITHVAGWVYGFYTNRDVNGAVGATHAGKLADWELTVNGANTMIGMVQFTNPADSRIYLSPLRVSTQATDYTVRGRLRGLWFFAHPISAVSDRDIFVGAGDLAGRTFMIIKKSPNAAVWCVETSNTWDTN